MYLLWKHWTMYNLCIYSSFTVQACRKFNSKLTDWLISVPRYNNISTVFPQLWSISLHLFGNLLTISPPLGSRGSNLFSLDPSVKPSTCLYVNSHKHDKHSVTTFYVWISTEYKCLFRVYNFNNNTNKHNGVILIFLLE